MTTICLCFQSNSVEKGNSLPRHDERSGRESDDSLHSEPFVNGDIYEEGGNRQRTSHGTEYFEAKATELVGWTIDAPVENNPIRSVPGRTAKR